MLRPAGALDFHVEVGLKYNSVVTGRISSTVEACRDFGLYCLVEAWLRVC